MRRVFAILALLIVAACATPPPPAPPAPLSPPSPPPAASDWRDLTLSSGDWSYAGGEASFGHDGVSLLRMRCERSAGVVEIALPLANAALATAAKMTVITSYGVSDIATTIDPAAQKVRARIAIADPLLDRIAFSRGRFNVQVIGAAQLVLPNWAEVSRVIEDCRS